MVSLLRAGRIEVVVSLEDIARRPGVILLDKVTAPLCDLIRQATAGGVERVIAVLMAPAGMRGMEWELLRAGASDVIRCEQVDEAAHQVAARLRRWYIVDELLESPAIRDNLMGESPRWRRALRQVVEIARFTDASILVTGESGTGKELVARTVHQLDGRPRKSDFVILDCTTVVPTLSGSEFFGHERGAFTGAVAAREGAFALANGGTLFLDEVGELPVALQAELLRVIQEGTYKRVGSNSWQRTDFRLICATNRDLKEEQLTGGFRRDFFFRIAGCVVTLPSLKERTEDIVPLVNHFFRQIRPDQDAPPLDPPVREFLLRRQYPGNIRELKNLVSRISYRHVGPGPVTLGDLPEEERPGPVVGFGSWQDEAFESTIRQAVVQGARLREITAAAGEAAIRSALCLEGGCLRRAASRLGVTDRALQMRQAAHRRHKSSEEVVTSLDSGEADGEVEMATGSSVWANDTLKVGAGGVATSPQL